MLQTKTSSRFFCDRNLVRRVSAALSSILMIFAILMSAQNAAVAEILSPPTINGAFPLATANIGGSTNSTNNTGTLTGLGQLGPVNFSMTATMVRANTGTPPTGSPIQWNGGLNFTNSTTLQFQHRYAYFTTSASAPAGTAGYAALNFQFNQPVGGLRFTWAGVDFGDSIEVFAYNGATQVPVLLSYVTINGGEKSSYSPRVNRFDPASALDSNAVGIQAIDPTSAGNSGLGVTTSINFVFPVGVMVDRVLVRNGKSNTSNGNVTTNVSGFAWDVVTSVQTRKTTIGPAGAFSFNGNNGLASPEVITTSVPNTTVAGAVRVLTNAGVATTITETIPAGWVANSGTCTGTAAGNVTFNPLATATTATIALNSAATAAANALVCTFTNTKQPTITLTKALGGNRAAAADQFTVAIRTGGGAGTVQNVTTNSTTAGVDNLVTAGSGTTGAYTVVAGTAYTLTEVASGGTNFALYDSTITCTDSAGLQSGLPTGAAFTPGATAGAGRTITPVNGAVIECTLTNTPKPRLTLVKTVINDNGGTAIDTAFTLVATGGTTISGVEGSVAVTNAVVNAGTYALSETGGPTGYTASAYSCTAGTMVGNNLTLTAGQVATCTITNNDIAPLLTLVKNVVNTGGGVETVATFPLAAAGPTPISGVSGTAAVTNAAVNAGAYTLSETTNANYTPSAWSCPGGSLAGAVLTLTPGQTITCTITNSFVPVLTLSINKQQNPATVTPLVVNQVVEYFYDVTNTGNVTVTGVSINDIHDGNGAPPVPDDEVLLNNVAPLTDSNDSGGSSNSVWSTLGPGDTVRFIGFYTVTQDDVDLIQ